MWGMALQARYKSFPSIKTQSWQFNALMTCFYSFIDVRLFVCLFPLLLRMSDVMVFRAVCQRAEWTEGHEGNRKREGRRDARRPSLVFCMPTSALPSVWSLWCDFISCSLFIKVPHFSMFGQHLHNEGNKLLLSLLIEQFTLLMIRYYNKPAVCWQMCARSLIKEITNL